MICPCCGQEASRRAPGEISASLALSTLEREAFDLLADSFGQWVPSDRLIDRLYGCRSDGGPSNDRGALASVLKSIRRKLAGTGLVVGFVPGRGNGERRLIWQELSSHSPTVNIGHIASESTWRGDANG